MLINEILQILNKIRTKICNENILRDKKVKIGRNRRRIKDSNNKYAYEKELVKIYYVCSQFIEKYN